VPEETELSRPAIVAIGAIAEDTKLRLNN
jgi:hypothetical protein